jgi:BMFP domain-containing protein YqiC
VEAEFDNVVSKDLIPNPGNYEALEQRITRLEAKLKELQSD